MKKLLALLSVLSLGATGTSAVVACEDESTVYNIKNETLDLVKNVIKTYEDAVTGVPVKKFTYEEFFMMKEEGNPEFNFIETYLYSEVRKDLQDNSEMPTDEIENQLQEVRKWVQEAVTLVYVDREYQDEESQQERITTITREDAASRNLERILKDELIAKYELGGDDDLTSEFWTAHNKASLALEFNPEVKNIKLGDDVKQFWTFTFVQEILEE